MKTRLGRQEAGLLAYAQMRKLRPVRTRDFAGTLRLTREQERELFRRMSRGGLIALYCWNIWLPNRKGSRRRDC